MEVRVVEGQRKAAMRLFCREEAGIPDPEQLPIWPEGVDFAPVDASSDDGQSNMLGKI
jgi:hypothetical protein